MDTERIERALREGPPDEPVYVPGGHRQQRRVLMLAGLGALVTAALLVGVAIGVTLNVLRASNGGVGSGIDVAALAAELEGTWDSTELSVASYRSELVARGHAAEDVEAAIANNGQFDRVRYRFVFAEDHLQIFAAFDGRAWESMSGGPYELQEDGSLLYDDIGCFITATFTIGNGDLSFTPIQTRSCNADETLNNTAFFNLVNYTRK